MSDETQTQVFTFNGNPTNFAQSAPRKKKGSEETTWYLFPHLESPAAVQEFVTKNIDPEKFWPAVYRELIKPAAADAFPPAYVAGDDGQPEFDSAKFTELFLEQFEPASRRSSGPSTKDLKDRMSAIAIEVSAAFAEYEAEKSEENHMKLNRLVLEMTELTQKIQAKSRVTTTPRKPRKKKEEAAAPVVA